MPKAGPGYLACNSCKF